MTTQSLSPTARALRRLREHLGLTQAEICDRLGLKLPTYQAYEYGHTKTVPDKVIERARALEADPNFQFLRAKFDGRSMDDIARDWAERAGIAPRPAALSAVLGVNKSTVSRWLADGSSRPPVARLAMYDRRIAEEEKWLASRRGARGNRRCA